MALSTFFPFPFNGLDDPQRFDVMLKAFATDEHDEDVSDEEIQGYMIGFRYTSGTESASESEVDQPVEITMKSKLVDTVPPSFENAEAYKKVVDLTLTFRAQDAHHIQIWELSRLGGSGGQLMKGFFAFSKTGKKSINSLKSMQHIIERVSRIEKLSMTNLMQP